MVTNSKPGLDVPGHLDVHLFLADPLALKGGPEGNGDRDLGDGDLEAPDLDGLGDDLVVRNGRDDVLVGADARGQDLVDVRVGDGREAVIDRPGRLGMFFIVDRAEGQDKGEDAVLVVAEDPLEIAGLGAAEREGDAVVEKPRAWMEAVTSSPKGTSRVSQPISTPSSASCWAMDLPSVAADMKT